MNEQKIKLANGQQRRIKCTNDVMILLWESITFDNFVNGYFIRRDVGVVFWTHDDTVHLMM